VRHCTRCMLLVTLTHVRQTGLGCHNQYDEPHVRGHHVDFGSESEVDSDEDDSEDHNDSYTEDDDDSDQDS
jgi:hypothetical protein